MKKSPPLPPMARPLLLLFTAAWLLACQAVTALFSPTPTPAVALPTGPQATATLWLDAPAIPTAAPPLAENASSRAQPLAPGTPIVLPHWQITVLEMVRGTEASDRTAAANMFNDPPPEGFEYVLLRLSVSKSPLAGANDYLFLGLTGSAMRLHFAFEVAQVAPEPMLSNASDMIAGTTAEGWELFLAVADERNLMLAAEESGDGESITHFVALEENAGVDVPAALADIQRNRIGTQATEPARFDQTIVDESWELLLLEMHGGEEAWQRIFAANRYNDPPPPGRQYVLLYARVRYIGNDEASQDLNGWDFRILDSQGQEWRTPAVVEPEPALSDFRLFAGGAKEGWFVMEAPAKDTHLLLQFLPPGDYAHARTRYISLQRQGR